MPLTDKQRHEYRLRDLMLSRRHYVSSAKAADRSAPPTDRNQAEQSRDRETHTLPPGRSDRT
jgi:hypothetical protein